MVLIALALVAIMAMAALSIDVVTLYLADAETQKAADTAALAGARILSITGMTGDPSNSTNNWSAACTLATQVAKAVAEQNAVGGAVLTNAQVSVTFSAIGSTSPDCSAMPAAFGVNPIVTVNVQRPNLPTFFARIWGLRGATISGSATAEVFNPSNSDNVTNGGPTGTVTPVQPRCVKPWVVPNIDPGNYPNPFVSVADGAIQHGGISLNGASTNGVIGENFNLFADCTTGSACAPQDPTPGANVASGKLYNGNPPPSLNNLEYLPGATQNASVAPLSSCSVSGSLYEQAILGCDQTTAYQCGVVGGNVVDLGVNPGGNSRDTFTGAQCLTTQGIGSGQDVLDTSSPYPFRIKAGSSNPLVARASLPNNSIITSSNSIVSLPIFDTTPGTTFAGGSQVQVTIVGFLQVFINQVSTTDGSLNVTVLNVAGCGNNTANQAVSGSSPVPVRLIQKYP
jgi:hypothetical protein